MANLIAPQQAMPAHVDSSLKSSALPADVKSVGKNGKEIQKDAKSASVAFDANLKEQVEKQTKKDQLKKANPEAQVATPAQVPQLAVGKNAKTEVQALDPKTGKPVIAAQAGAPQSAQAKALQALLAEKAGQDAEKGLAQKLTPATKDNLTPLQQVMLNDTLANKRAVVAGAPGSPQVGPSGAVANAELSQALESLGNASPEIEHEFDVESLAVGGAAGKAILNSKDGESGKRAASSKVSTSDFLDLRNNLLKNPIAQNQSQSSLDLGTALKSKDGKKDKLEALTGKEAFAGTLATRFENSPNLKTIDAPVTTGGSGKTVLSHDSVHQVAQSVNMLSQARQDGEIKIRLRPDHLGELHMSVKTQGQQVSIEIKAQNSESKKIIEASLASLKDSLGQQNLTLARIDIVNAPAHAQNAADQGMQMDMSQFRQNSGQGSGNGSERGFDQAGNRADLYSDEMSKPVNINTARIAGMNARSAGQGLDLIA